MVVSRRKQLHSRKKEENEASAERLLQSVAKLV